MIDPRALAPLADEADLLQGGEIAGHRVVGPAERVDQLADAQLPAGQGLQDAEAVLVAEDPQEVGRRVHGLGHWHSITCTRLHAVYCVQ